MAPDLALDRNATLDFLTALDAAGARPGAPESSAGYGETGWRGELTRRLRVLIHAEPLLALRANQGQQQPDRRHYDALALALRVFDLVLAGMGLDRGVGAEDVTRALRPLLLAMDSAETLAPDPARHSAVVGRVLDALLNDSDGRKKFRATYTDLTPHGVARPLAVEFKLLEEYEQLDGSIAYRLTNEAINLFLGALDRDIADEQVAAEALIKEQLERGSFIKAVHSAEHAQLQSRRYVHFVEAKLRLVRRDVAMVRWREEVTPILEEASGHVSRRLDAERIILEAANLQFERLAPDSEEARQVRTVIQLVTGCQARHAMLSRTIVDARGVFLSEHGRQGFASTVDLERPDLLRDVLHPLLALKTTQAVRVTDVMLGRVALPHAPGVLDLSSFIRWCLRPRREVTVGVVAVPAPDIVDLPVPLLRFSAEIRRAAEETLRATQRPRLLSQLLQDHAARGTTPEVLECIALMALLEHGRDPAHTPLVDVMRLPTTFSVAGIHGDDLALTAAVTKAPSEAASAVGATSHVGDQSARPPSSTTRHV